MGCPECGGDTEARGCDACGGYGFDMQGDEVWTLRVECGACGGTGVVWGCVDCDWEEAA